MFFPYCFLCAGMVCFKKKINEIGDDMMQYYVNQCAASSGDGSRKKPFLTVSEAARAAQPGDEVVVAPGVYREQVDPPKGGDGEDSRIVFRAEHPGKTVITGAEVLGEWRHVAGDVWRASLPSSVFSSVNPYQDIIDGDWFYRDPLHPVHRGQVFAQDQALMEATDPDALQAPTKEMKLASPWGCWRAQCGGEETVFFVNLYGRDPNALQMECTVRPAVFHPSRTHIDYITLSGFVLCKAATQWAPPTAYQQGLAGPHWAKGWVIEDCEVYGSRCVGITLGKYLQPDNENKWTKKYYKHGTQTERDAVMQAVNEGWGRQTVGSHVIRRCHIHDCGQAGIAGHMGGAFSLIEENHIHDINLSQELAGAEIGGIKLHAAIDTVIRKNRIHHCTRGLWLDWQAQGTRVTGNIFHHNEPLEGLGFHSGLSLGEDLFVEVSHGPTLIDHNLFLSPCAARISTQGIAFAQNLIAGSFTCVGTGTNNAGLDHPESARYTPYHVPHDTLVAGFMSILHGDARFYNNIFVQQPAREDIADYIAASGRCGMNALHLVCGTVPYDGYPTAEEYFSRFTEQRVRGDRTIYYDHLPVYTGGNVYFNGAQPCDTEKEAYLAPEEAKFSIIHKNGKWQLETSLFSLLPSRKLPVIDTAVLGTAFESEQPFEGPDGSFLTLDTDLQGKKHGPAPLCGPFAENPGTVIPLE